MIDPDSGMLTFETPPASIAPSLTRAQFLVSALAKGAVTFVDNEPFHSWKINRTLRSCEVDFVVVLFFSGERLTMISLMNTDPRFGTSWADYSLENELARKASHDQWLARISRLCACA